MQDIQDLKTSNTYYDEFDFLSLLIQKPSFMDLTIIKALYLHDKNQLMFKVLMADHKVHKEISLNYLAQYQEWDADYYTDLLANDVYYTNIDNKFKELEQGIIANYKLEQIQNFVKDCKDFDTIYKEVETLNEINDYDNEFINTSDMVNELTVKKTKLELGYPLLDSVLNLSQGDLLILAGGTGTGKTTFALNLLSKLSKDYQCVYFNMEMSKNILYRRLIAIETQITLKDLNDLSTLSVELKHKVKDAMDDLETRKIMLINKSLNISDISKTIAKIKQTKPLIVFLDHIGLIKSSGNSLYEKMTNIAKELRSISMNYGCTVIGLCQLSRESQRNETAPKLQDLRDSGEIEQSARKVLLLYNKAKDPQQREHPMEVIIAKNDDGFQNISKDFFLDRYTQKFREKY